MKRVLFVDHVDRVLGGAEVNLIELLEAARTRENWEVACACRSGSHLGSALLGLGIRCFDYGLDEGLNRLRFSGGKFPWMRIWRGMRALDKASEGLRKIVR